MKTERADAESPEPVGADPAVEPAEEQGPAATRPGAPPVRPFWARLDRPFYAGFALTLGGLLAIALGTAVSHLSTVLIAIAFALFAALGLDPVVTRLEKHGVRRGWGIVTVSLVLAVLFAGVLLLIIPTAVAQVAQIVQHTPTWIADFQKSAVYAWLESTFGSETNSLMSQVTSFLTNPSQLASIGGGVLKVGTSIATGVSMSIIVLVLSLYFLAALPAMKKAGARLAPARVRPRVTSMTEQIASSVGGYLSGMVVLAFCNSVVAFVLHLALGLPFPLLMAVTAFCITLIPLVGSVLYWGIATTLALFTGWLPALLFAAIYLVYMQLEAYVLTPRVMSRTISVPGALVVIGALVGGTLLGLLGALIAIPVTASILLIVRQIVVPRQDAKV